MSSWAVPKADAVRRHKPTYATGELVVDGRLRGPALPKDRPWCKHTRDWWQMWRKSAQAQVMQATDWEYMLETALLHHELWRDHGGDVGWSAARMTSLAVEIRRRCMAYGYTDMDRQRLRMRVDEQPDPNAEPVTKADHSVPDITNYRKRLSG